MKYLALKIEYDGTNYAGWQQQPNAPTVQEALLNAARALNAQGLKIDGAGRTDSGVHAAGQVASAPIGDDFHIPENKIKPAFNSVLPHDIRICSAKILNKPFHARFDAYAREYSYRLGRSVGVFDRLYVSRYMLPYSPDKLEESAEFFIGGHNFMAFSKNNPDTPNHVCTIEKCVWKLDAASNRSSGIQKLEIKADRFLYGMVRAIVGAMLDYSRGRRCYDDIIRSLNSPRGFAVSPLAPPQGLVFEKAFYDESFGLDF